MCESTLVSRHKHHMVPIFGWIFHINIEAVTHALIAGLGDEFSLAVDAGVGTLAGDPLLPLGHVAGGRRAAARFLRTWEPKEACKRKHADSATIVTAKDNIKPGWRLKGLQIFFRLKATMTQIWFQYLLPAALKGLLVILGSREEKDLKRASGPPLIACCNLIGCCPAGIIWRG